MMNRLGKLIVNEHIKIYARLGTWTMFVSLLLVVIGGGLAAKYMFDEPEGGSWQQQVKEANTEMRQVLAEGKLSSAATIQYERELTLNDYRLAHDIPPVDYDINNIWAFAKLASVGVPNMIDLVALFTIIVAAGIVASEFSSGAIKLLLIRPVSRSMILLSKYVTTLAFALGMLIMLFIVSLLTGGVLFGFGGISDPQLLYSQGQVIEKSMFLHVMQSYGLSSIRLVMLVTIAFLISAAFRNSSMAIGLSLFLLFAGPRIVLLLKKFAWSKYILFANTDLSMYINEMPFRSEMTLPFSLTVLSAYFICFILLSWYIFRSRDVLN